MPRAKPKLRTPAITTVTAPKLEVVFSQKMEERKGSIAEASGSGSYLASLRALALLSRSTFAAWVIPLLNLPSAFLLSPCQ